MRWGLLLLLGASACGRHDESVGDTGNSVRCNASLASACASGDYPVGVCPPFSASALPGPWCQGHPNSGRIHGSCAGYAVFPVGTGVDTSVYFMYSAASGDLVAALTVSNGESNGNGIACAGGNADFAIPLTCFGELGSELVSFTGPGAAAGCSTYDAGVVSDVGD